MDVSVVIPTRNRQQSLMRLLNCLDQQTYPLREVIIVDSSKTELDVAQLQRLFQNLKINYILSEPSVCIQRNIGIRRANSTHVFLCDDDVEPQPNYVSTLMGFLQQHPDVGAVSGLFVEADKQGNPQFEFRTSFKQLLWNFIFQLSVSADLDKIKPNLMNYIPFQLIKRFYLWRKNTYSLAGWPLITRFGNPSFKTAIYTLGASIVRRNWLIQTPYDEILDYHGIGENYGVEVNFPQKQAVTIVTGTYAFHHRESGNRPAARLAFYRRILALHYFMKGSDRFNWLNQAFLIWSLMGIFLTQRFIQKAEFFSKATLKAFRLIISGRNPYLLARQRGEIKPVNPQLK